MSKKFNIKEWQDKHIVKEASNLMDSDEIKDFYKAVDALEMLYNKLIAGKDLDSRDQKKLKKDMLHYINKQL